MTFLPFFQTVMLSHIMVTIIYHSRGVTQSLTFLSLTVQTETIPLSQIVSDMSPQHTCILSQICQYFSFFSTVLRGHRLAPDPGLHWGGGGPRTFKGASVLFCSCPSLALFPVNAPQTPTTEGFLFCLLQQPIPLELLVDRQLIPQNLSLLLGQDSGTWGILPLWVTLPSNPRSASSVFLGSAEDIVVATFGLSICVLSSLKCCRFKQLVGMPMELAHLFTNDWCSPRSGGGVLSGH